MKKHILPIALLFLIAGLAFRSWFDFTKVLSFGDWQYLFADRLRDYLTFVPSLWQQTNQNGFGGSIAFSLNFYPFLFLSGIFAQVFHTDIAIGERIFWFFPAVIFSLFSSYYLSWVLFRNRALSFFSSIIYIFNTPFLLWLSGGQPTIAAAYSLIPFALAFFIQLLTTQKRQYIVFLGFTLFLSGLYDLRILGLTFGVIIVYYIYLSLIQRKMYVKDIVRGFVSGGVFLLLSSFWIVPLVFSHKPSLQDIAGDLNAQFLSWATFPHSLSLLHPFWPENIFGKVLFFDPKFLLIPILAFSSLVFLGKDKKVNRNIIFFSLLSLVSVFLTKGTQPPFGQAYTFLYTHVPGFTLYRDSTKFYSLVILGYSVLIPFTLSVTFNWLIKHFHKKNNLLHFTPHVFLILALSYLLFLAAPLFTGRLTGTLQPRQVPVSYEKLAQIFAADSQKSRVLWIPEWNRFGYYTNTHPAVSSNVLFLSATCKRAGTCAMLPKGKDIFALTYLDSAQFYPLLLRLHVRYLVVPIDSDKAMEVFLTNRKEDPAKRNALIAKLDTMNFLQKRDIEGIMIYTVKGSFTGSWDISPDLVHQANQDQKYVLAGYILSGSTLLLIIFSLLFTRKYKV